MSRRGHYLGGSTLIHTGSLGGTGGARRGRSGIPGLVSPGCAGPRTGGQQIRLADPKSLAKGGRARRLRLRAERRAQMEKERAAERASRRMIARIENTRRLISSLEAEKEALLGRGVDPGLPSIRAIEARIAARRRRLMSLEVRLIDMPTPE